MHAKRPSSQLQQIFSETDKDDFQADVKRVRQLLSPFVLRRVKQDVTQDLPPKVEKTVTLDMRQTRVQQHVYSTLVSKLQAQRRVKSSGKDAASAVDLVASKEFEHIATTCSMFTELRKAANHPLLVRNR